MGSLGHIDPTGMAGDRVTGQRMGADQPSQSGILWQDEGGVKKSLSQDPDVTDAIAAILVNDDVHFGPLSGNEWGERNIADDAGTVAEITHFSRGWMDGNGHAALPRFVEEADHDPLGDVLVLDLDGEGNLRFTLLGAGLLQGDHVIILQKWRCEEGCAHDWDRIQLVVLRRGGFQDHSKQRYSNYKFIKARRLILVIIK